MWKKYKQLYTQGGVVHNAMVFTYDFLVLSLFPTAIRATAARHHSHNKFRLTGWVEYNSGPKHSQYDDGVRIIQWMVKEVIHKNNNDFLATQLQSSITIQAVIDGSYHPTYLYLTSVRIIKIQYNDHKITGANVFPGDSKYQYYFRRELCGHIGSIRHLKNI